MLHGRIPYNVLDLKMGIHPEEISTPISQIAADVLEQTEIILQDIRKNNMQENLKYKA